MAVAGVLATALTTQAAKAYALWVDGTDVLRDPVSGRWGADIRDVNVTVNGPGGTSTLDCIIDDPGDLLTLGDGQTVVLHDLTNDKRLFTGWVEHYALSPDFGGQGRLIRLSAVGPESILDWAVTGGLRTYTNLPLTDMIQGLVAASTDVRGLRAFVDTVNDQGSQARPIGNMAGASPTGVESLRIDVESGTAPWVAAGITGYVNAATLAAVGADAPPGGGTACISIAASGAAQDQMCNVPLPGTFIAGTTYALSFWIKLASGSGDFFQWLFGSSGTTTDRAYSLGQTVSGTWTRYTMAWTPTSNRVDAVLAIASYGFVAGTVRVDLVTVQGGGIVTIPAGTSLRQAIQIAAAACVDQVNFFGISLTVDHTLGLRCWEALPTPVPPSDVLTPITVSTAGTNKPTSLSYDVDVSGIVRGVLVLGTAVTVFVSDGSGKPGRSAVLSDSNIDTTVQAQARGQAYINDYGVGLRGSLVLSDVTSGPTAAIDALKLLALTDPSTGVSGSYVISALVFTFYGTKRDVGVQFGGLAPAASGVMRRLTRGTLS